MYIGKRPINTQNLLDFQEAHTLCNVSIIKRNIDLKISMLLGGGEQHILRNKGRHFMAEGGSE
jgi:hypothetical protein